MDATTRMNLEVHAKLNTPVMKSQMLEDSGSQICWQRVEWWLPGDGEGGDEKLVFKEYSFHLARWKEFWRLATQSCEGA